MESTNDELHIEVCFLYEGEEERKEKEHFEVGL